MPLPSTGIDAAAVERFRDVEEGDLVIEEEHAVFELREAFTRLGPSMKVNSEPFWSLKQALAKLSAVSSNVPSMS